MNWLSLGVGPIASEQRSPLMVVGVAIPGEDTPRLHYEPRFDANEDVLTPGVTVLATVAQYYLGRASVGSGR